MKNNNIKIKNTYNMAKQCTGKKNKLLKMNYIKSILLNEENKKMEEIENKNNEEKNNIENIENINSESISYKSSSRAKNNFYKFKFHLVPKMRKKIKIILKNLIVKMKK